MSKKKNANKKPLHNVNNNQAADRAPIEEKSRIPAVLVLVLSFLIPMICMVICYAVSGIYPGGEKTMLATDMNQQITEFFGWYNRFLNGDGSMMYSFEKGIGGNMFGLWAYYLASPFALLMLFFEADKAHIAVWLMSILKIGASGLTFALFLRYMTKKLDLSTVVFSTVYALMSYSMCYQLIIMWLDGVIFLPLVIIAVEKILRDKKWGMFVCIYPVTVITGYYTAYMITIFVALWFIYRYFAVENGKYFQRSLRDFAFRISALIGAGILGALLSIWVLLPTANDIMAGKMSANLMTYDGCFAENVWGTLIKIFIGQYDSLITFKALESGSPSIFTGVISMILGVAFFFNKNITKREKLFSFLMFGVFALSFIFTAIDKVWHMFLYPNWFPFRYVFCFSFFAVYIAYKSFVNIKGMNAARLAGAIALPLFLMLAVVFTKEELIKAPGMIKATFAVLGVYAVILFANRGFKKFDLRYATLAILIVVMFEMTANGAMFIKGIDKQFGYVRTENFTYEMGRAKDTAEQIESRDSGFYRVETNIRRTINETLGAGYRGVTHFSSTFNNTFNNFHESLGALQESINYSHNGATIVYDSIFGVKYIMSDKQPSEAMEFRFENAAAEVYENPYALPIGFMTENYSESQVTTYNNNLFMENNNKFTEFLMGDSFFTPCAEVNSLENGKLVFIDEDGALYISLPTKYNLKRGIKLVLNGREIPYDYAKVEAKVLYLGEYKAGDELEVYFDKAESIKNSAFHVFDGEKFEKAINKTKEQSLNVTKFSDTYIEGTVNCKADGYLFTTIPYEENGWRAFVDGEEVEILKSCDVFNSLKLTQGEHTVVFKYRTPYLDLGIAISAGALLGILGYLYLKHRKEKAMANNSDEPADNN